MVRRLNGSLAKTIIHVLSTTPREKGSQAGDRWRSVSHGNPTPTWFSRWPPSLRDPLPGAVTRREYHYPDRCSSHKLVANQLFKRDIVAHPHKGVVAHRYTCFATYVARCRKYLLNVYAVF